MRDLAAPEPGPGQVRIRTRACGVCATDLEMIAGWDRTGFPSVPGHEWCGVVEKAGAGVDAGLVGGLCVGENVLSDGGEVGFEHPGGYAELFVTEADKLHLLPPHFPPDVAALIEPLAVSVRGLRRLRPEKTTATLVFGDGPIGLIMLMLLKRAGLQCVFLVGGRPWRLELARDLGADGTIDYHACADDLPGRIAAAAGGRPIRTVVEASGAAGAMDAALSVSAPRAKVLVLGDYGRARAGFRWNELLHGEWELIGSCASAGAWCEAVEIAQDECFPLARLVSHRFGAGRFAEALDLVSTRAEGVVKVVIMWDGDTQGVPSPKALRRCVT